MNSELKILVLGGTAWLGREVSSQAVMRGHSVFCLARGESGPVADGATLIQSDRNDPNAYDAVRGHEWDAVIELGWQPGLVRSALVALRSQTRHWIYLSSGSVYSSHASLGADEGAPIKASTELDEVGMNLYGEAKVACELASGAAGSAGLLIVRSGLIGGPGDGSDRAGYWVARSARDPLGPMLVPDSKAITQLVDVRDLAQWLLYCAEEQVTGTYDAVGPTISLDALIALSREIGGHSGPVVRADETWLLANGVEEFMGPDSLPLWLADPQWQGFCARTGNRAHAAGLKHRSLSDTLTDTLGWEQELGLDRPRKSGMASQREAGLLANL